MLVIEKNDETIAVIKSRVYQITSTGVCEDKTYLFDGDYYPECPSDYQRVLEEVENYHWFKEKKMMLHYAMTGTRYAVHRLLFEHGYPAVHHWYIDNQTINLSCDCKAKPDMVAIARWGCVEVQDRLVNHKNAEVRKAVAEYGQEHHREALLDDTCSFVLTAIIKNGTKEQVAKVYNGAKSRKGLEGQTKFIASSAVEYGDDNLRTVILNDLKHDTFTMSRVAIYGADNHRDELVEHEDLYIRVLVAACGSDQHRERLLVDKEPKVRASVARFGNQAQKFLLLQDADPRVVEQAKLPLKGRLVREQG